MNTAPTTCATPAARSGPGLSRRQLLGATLLAVGLPALAACGRKPPKAQAVAPGATVPYDGISLLSYSGIHKQIIYIFQTNFSVIY